MNYRQGYIKNLHYGIIHSWPSEIISSQSLPFINEDSVPKKYTVAKPGDLFLADTSEDRKDCGKGIEIDNEDNESVVGGLHTIHIRDENTQFVPYFKSLFTRSLSYHKFAYKYSEGIKVFSLKPALFKYLIIYYPEKLEQQKIVNIIRVVNEKLSVIKKKITALKKYKKGLINLCFSFGQTSTISSFVTQLDLRNKSNEKLTVFSISNKKGFIPQEEQFEGNEIASSDKSNYKVVKKGDFAYNPARINVGSIGFLSEEIGQVSPMYVVFSTHGIGNILLNEYFHSNFFRKELKKHLEGSVRQTLSFSNLGNFAIQVPDQKEKFDVLFSTINHQLDNLEKTLQIILKAKRFLLDNLFL